MEQIRIVLEGLRGDDSIAELCHRGALHGEFTPNGRRTLWRQVNAVLLMKSPVPPTMKK